MSGFSLRFHSTNDSITTWSSASREALEEKYQSESPLTALSNEADQITPLDVSEEVACIRAIDGLTHLFEKLCVKSPDEKRVIEEVRDKVFARINGTDLSRLSMYELIERIHAQPPNSFSPHAPDFAYFKMCQIRGYNKAKGIIYKVTNEFGVSSYLVGAIHVVHQNTLPLNGRVSQILSVAQELILESKHPNVDRVKIETKSESFGLNCMFDSYWLKEAEKLNKRISFLESEEYNSEITRVENEISARAKFSEEQIKFLQIHGDLKHYELIEAFQNGNFEEVAHLCKRIIRKEKFDYSSTERNRVWVYGGDKLCEENQPGLSSRLKTTKAPLVIVVGVAHLFFEGGLSKTLKREGLKVERDS